MTTRNHKDEAPGPLGCPEVRSALLEVTPGELEEGGTGPIARHLVNCPGCRERARQIREWNGALRTALSELEPRMSTAEAEALAVGGGASGEEAGEGARTGVRTPAPEGIRPEAERKMRRRRLLWGALIPAAAVLGALLVGRGILDTPGPEGALRAPPDFRDDEPATRVHVDVAPGTRTLVLASPDPTITVIWLH